MKRITALVALLAFLITGSAAHAGKTWTVTAMTGSTQRSGLGWSTASFGHYTVPARHPETTAPYRPATRVLQGIGGALGLSVDPRNVAYGYSLSIARLRDRGVSDVDIMAGTRMKYQHRGRYIEALGGLGYNELDGTTVDGRTLRLGGHLFLSWQFQAGINIPGSDAFATLTWTHRSNGSTQRHNDGLNALLFGVSWQY